MSLKISVIIPIYNSEKYLKQCVESILKQTYRNLEIILIDDGSTDSSGEMCEKYAKEDERVKVVHQKNARIGAARNAGIDISTGDLITFIDSDDELKKTAYESVVSYFADDEVDMVEWDVEYFNDDTYNGSEINQEVCPETVALKKTALETMHFMFDLKHMDPRFNNMGLVTHCVWTKIFRKSLLENGLRFPVGKEYEDEIIVHRLIEKARKIVTVNNRFSRYRLRAGSTIHTMPLNGKYNKLEAFEDRFYMILGYQDEQLKRLSAREYLLCLINFYSAAANENDKQYLSIAKEKAKKLKNYFCYYRGMDLAVCVSFVEFPSLFNCVYKIYRKQKEK